MFLLLLVRLSSSFLVKVISLLRWIRWKNLSYVEQLIYEKSVRNACGKKEQDNKEKRSIEWTGIKNLTMERRIQKSAASLLFSRQKCWKLRRRIRKEVVQGSWNFQNHALKTRCFLRKCTNRWIQEQRVFYGKLMLLLIPVYPFSLVNFMCLLRCIEGKNSS